MQVVNCLTAMSLDKKFEAATEAVETKWRTDKKISITDGLELYAYKQQALVGDVNIKRPGWTDIAGKYKWDAWNARKGLSAEVAKEKYINKALSMGIQI